MTKKIQKASHIGTLEIGNLKIPCAVLEDGSRLLSETGITESLGARTGGAKRAKKQALENEGAPIPLFLASQRLKPYINNELSEGLMHPIPYLHGNRTAFGFPAHFLPEICDVWLKAREEGALQEQQKARAKKAEIIMRGLAHIGIIALVDEATGYQEVRDKKALAELLDKYLRKELAAWAKRFPDEFYKEMFRLRGWPWNPSSVAKPSVVGRYTNDLVYERLAPNILEELEKKNPKNDSGNRTNRHHQWLSDDVGHPALAQHLHSVMGFMRASTTWDSFYRLMQRAFPKKGATLEMPLDD